MKRLVNEYLNELNGLDQDDHDAIFDLAKAYQDAYRHIQGLYDACVEAALGWPQ